MDTTTLDAFWTGFTTNTVAMINSNQTMFAEIFIVVLVIAVAGAIFLALTGAVRNVIRKSHINNKKQKRG